MSLNNIIGPAPAPASANEQTLAAQHWRARFVMSTALELKGALRPQMRPQILAQTVPCVRGNGRCLSPKRQLSVANTIR